MKQIKERVIILEDCKFDWAPEEIEQAKELFSLGCKPTEVARIMNQKIIDVGLLLIHLIEQGELKS